MFEIRENLSFTQEPPDDEITIQTSLDELDGNFLFVLFVGAGREIDRSHAAAAKLLYDFVRTYALAGYRAAGGVIEKLHHVVNCGLIYERAGLLKSRDQRLDLVARLCVTGARLRDKR